MTQAFVKPGRGLLALLIVAAVAVAACGSSSKGTATPGSSATASSQASASASTETSAQPSGGGLTNADAAFANINSYKFTMVILSSEITGSLAALTGGSADQAMTFQGTVIVKPTPAASITIGTLRIIETGGKQYIDMGTGSFIATDQTGTSMAESFSPATMFGSFVGATNAEGYNKVGSGQKNGVSADHYQANDAVSSEFGATTGITGATWSSEAWVATDGGYPVSFSIIGNKDGKVVYQISFDVMNVNDPANKVEAPTV